MTQAEPYPPLYAAALRAEAAWMAEVTKEAKRRGLWPGDLRYHGDAERLPGYDAYVAAREAWFGPRRP